jgi:hypothetical protein
MRSATGLFAATLLLSVTASGCGSTRIVTKTTTETRTTTVTETIVRHTPAPQPVYVAESGGRLLYKPSAIVTGASGGQIYFDKWIGYGNETASAEARFEMNDCTPTCAEGKHSFVHARIAARTIVPCRGVPAYERLYVQRTDDESTLPVGDEVDLVELCHEGDVAPP